MDVEVNLSDIEMTFLAQLAAELGLSMEEMFVQALNDFVAKNKQNKQ